MTVLDAIKARRSVRQYKNIPIDPVSVAQLEHEIERCNRQWELHIQLITEESDAFDCMLSRLMKFSGVRNYIALVGPKNDPDLQEHLGYCGEILALKAQALGLNTCWVAGTYSKGDVAAQIAPTEKLLCVITLGYGKNNGATHKRKPTVSLFTASEPIPNWFIQGVKAARRAPTAMNQQNFHFTLLDGNRVRIRSGGFSSKINKGILKYHFEIGAGVENFTWE